MIRDLAKKLSAFSELVDTVIIELEYRRGVFEACAEILKTHSAMALVRVSSSDAEILVKLIRPRTEIQATVGSRIQSAEKIWRIFTASEVFDFVEAVGDENKIHKINPPIVPGLLILETLCAQFPACQSIKLRFKKFITAGEPLSLQRDGNKFEICSAGVRKILMTFELE